MRGNVFIAGLGLIGGSLALTIKKQHPNSVIYGFDVVTEEMDKASFLKVIDKRAESFQKGAEIADLIILATPVLETERLMEQLANMSLKEHVLITDTGSTKKSIVKKALQLAEKGIAFIGGHPMAGSHKSGVTAAKDQLFENAFYILTPTSHQSAHQLKLVKDWLSGTKARFIELTAEDHDEMTGILSHFPHIIASSLVEQAKDYQSTFPLLSRLAAGGFRDITRIASADPNMWASICVLNKDVLLKLLRQWQVKMNQVTELIEEEKFEKLFSFFQEAKIFRDELPSHSTGAIHSFYDLFIDVPDYPGVISEITGYLAEENISITNIRILETREDIYGVLRISFQNEQDRGLAKECLEKRTTYDLFIQ
ncbi:prephenate dehydrogenase [Bacillus sp. FJAT-49736]|uniref:prephenate dehydrogenase n=1 Tax=Bacillus sp. FJAT-49736 TaxID=2833582 RepID=UPI001BC95152|nr:prephenate dehydrogenase [Bacillus sp. FJAT-49736]MBS4173271.1 prephenate dehydrogenase [Bacillus sp. FJAT-49736]